MLVEAVYLVEEEQEPPPGGASALLCALVTALTLCATGFTALASSNAAPHVRTAIGRASSCHSGGPYRIIE